MSDEELIARLRDAAQKRDEFEAMMLASVSADKIEALEAQIERFRNTNRRMNRRVQLLEGWWQRRLEKQTHWKSVYMGIMKQKNPSVTALEEAAYQRGYADGFDERFRMPKRWARPKRKEGGE